jgi:transcriptional regulator with XRE-family HTH domain
MKTRQPLSASQLVRKEVLDDRAIELLKEEHISASVAEMIYERRQASGLTQQELADMVGTTQSVISRLENADYEGHSLTMLHRIASALRQQLYVSIEPKAEAPPNTDDLTRELVFRDFVQKLRRSKRLTLDALAKRLDVEREELAALEQWPGYKPSTRLLHSLSEFFQIPQRSLAILAGAIKEIPTSVKRQLSQFAAKSESFDTLTKEEKQQLDELITALKAET